ncbi:hypothetical protein [Geodermatophilus sp. SYSU D01105]
MTTQPGSDPRSTGAPIEDQISTRMLDVRRTDLHSRFFHVFQYRFASELLDDLAELPIDHSAFGRSLDSRQLHYGGWHYWLLYLKGYAQYRRAGAIDQSNVYLHHLTRGHAPERGDPILHSAQPEEVTQMISRRFADCDRLGSPAVAREFARHELTPVKAFVRTPPSTEDTLTLFSTESPEPTRARLVDGHHRLFAARLFGVEQVRFEVVVEPDAVPEIPGQITCVDLGDNTVRMQGWLEPPTTGAQLVELRWKGRTIGRAPLTTPAPTPHPNRPRVRGFSVDIEPSSVDSIGTVEVMVLSDWLPVAALHLDLGQTGWR